MEADSLTYLTYRCISKVEISCSLCRKIKNVRLAHLHVTTQETALHISHTLARVLAASVAREQRAAARMR